MRTASSRATNISKTVQNEISQRCGMVILSHILQRVRNSLYFSILFDDTTHLSHMSWLSLAVRYVHKGGVHEDFLEFVDVHAEVYGRGDDDADDNDVDCVSNPADSSHHDAMIMVAIIMVLLRIL